MKNLIFGIMLLTAPVVFGQFKISGEIKNYSEKPVMVRMNKGAGDKLVNRVETDKNGKFSINIPQKYSGIVSLTNLQRSSTIEVLTDNEDVDLTAAYAPDGTFKEIVFKKGANAIGFQNYQSFQNLNDLKNNIFPLLKSQYDSSDEFYQAITKEEARISKLNPAVELPLLKYYSQVSELANAQVDNKSTGEIYTNKILSRLNRDNDYLEGSGYLSTLVLNYFRYSIIGATSQEEINSTVEKEIDHLLEVSDIETPRGQNVLSAIFMVLPKEQFGSLLEKYYSKANNLTCEITEELKSNLAAHNMTVGNKVPDIKFKEAVKGFKSLYDVKANQKIIVFWASWCPACRDEMPFIKEYYQTFKKEGGEIVAISLDFDQNEFKNATKDFDWLNYTELSQWDTQGVEEFGVSSTPTLFLVDKDNNLIKKASHISELLETK
ncbi:MAG: TlpA disulfide reductase family protein [Weeksellaceae bacterium]